jgi:DNA gyrase inhibitor GyrI
MTYESPQYEVLARQRGYEIREYESYLVAQTNVDGTFQTSGNRAFRRLAGYIFGDNQQSTKMAMTVPVTRRPVAAGNFEYRFVMESAYDESTLPQPNDARIEIRRVPGGTFAVRRYRGSTGESRYRKEERALLAALAASGISPAGPAVAAVYNGPLTPPPLRHNEVIVPVGWPPAT